MCLPVEASGSIYPTYAACCGIITGMKNDCVFCAIAAGEIPSFKVYEDDLVLAYLDINPFSKGHTLVIPKEHYTGLIDTPDETLAALIERVKKVAAHLKTALPCDGFNILQNNGEAAGQTVMHIHFHIVPRYGKENISFVSHEGDMTELKALSEKIRVP
jgi:histidine triad (HIT) family protein